MSFAKFLRTPFFTEHLRWLLLFFINCRNYFPPSDLLFFYFQNSYCKFRQKLLWLLNKHSFRKHSQGITTDVSICFINYEMIKTHVIKQTGGTVWIKIAFIKRVYITCLICHFLEAANYFEISPISDFFSLNNILALPKLLLSLKLGLVWHHLCLPCFCLPDLHACALVYGIKTNASRL